MQLVAMSQARYEQWRDRLWGLYYDELIQAGYGPEAARANVDDSIAESMPDGVLAPGNFVFDLVEGDGTVGVTWLVQNASKWMIYDIEVNEELRGQGLGRQAMKAIEEYVRERDGESIGLSVFGFNKAAIKLYESAGYETVRMSMRKVLA